MTGPRQFLIALGRALSATHLYGRGHPARKEAIEDAWTSLGDLLHGNPRSGFTVLGDLVAFQGRLVHGLRNWSVEPRLAAAGIQRIEFTAPVPFADFEAFVEAADAAMTSQPRPPAPHPSIRVGPATMEETLQLEEEEAARRGIEALLDTEIDAVDSLFRSVADGAPLPRVEVETIVSSLLLNVLSADGFLPPLLRLKDFDQYTTAHSLNVAVLSMALAEFSGWGRDQIRAMGVAGVLHDIGKVRTPPDVLNKTGSLSSEEWQIMRRHPVDGARIILESGQADLELAAIVAYEHHVWFDGRGYPQLEQPRPCHPASNLLHVCDVFDALATDRPYRPAWPEAKILDLIRENAGSEFDPAPAATFLRMMTRCAAIPPTPA